MDIPTCECGCGLTVPGLGLRFYNKVHSRRNWGRVNRDKKKIIARKSYLKNRASILAVNGIWRSRNKEKIARDNRNWYLRNRERLIQKSKTYGRKWRAEFPFRSPEDKAKLRATKARCSTRHYYRNWEAERRKRNERGRQNRTKLSLARRLAIKKRPELQIQERLRTRLKRAVKGHGRPSIRNLIGCSWQFLKEHIESQFLYGMSWDNRSKWHIDHKTPCAAFDLSQIDQQLACFHWSNLQPLWATDNLRKGAKLVAP